ncbi:MAG TPA: hypothetical protein VN428_02860 [Bryobacteraceae bacterium]|nr:hypothetical protein [Bryobacteraceae bacterium]
MAAGTKSSRRCEEQVVDQLRAYVPLLGVVEDQQTDVADIGDRRRPEIPEDLAEAVEQRETLSPSCFPLLGTARASPAN